MILGATEFGHGGVSLLADAISPKYLPEGAPQNGEVEAEGEVVYIPHVTGKFFFPTCFVAAVNLRPASDAGAGFVAAHLLGSVAGEVLHEERPWPDEAHFPFEDVPQFGQFVEAGGAEEAAEGGQAVGIGQELAVGIPLVGHGAEFDEGEGAAVVAGALLGEEDGGAEAEADENGRGQQDGGSKHQHYKGDGDIKQAFGVAAVKHDLLLNASYKIRPLKKDNTCDKV